SCGASQCRRPRSVSCSPPPAGATCPAPRSGRGAPGTRRTWWRATRSTSACWSPSAGTARTRRCGPPGPSPTPGWTWRRPSPAGLADEVDKIAAQLGLRPAVAFVTGDDLLGRMADLRAAGLSLANTDTGQRLADAGVEPVTANAYLGGWPITEALAAGSDVVI